MNEAFETLFLQTHNVTLSEHKDTQANNEIIIIMK